MMKSMKLSKEQIQFYRVNGYLMVPGVVPAHLCRGVIAAIDDYILAAKSDPLSWINQKRHQSEGHGIVPLHHHQSLWDVRQLPAIHEIFADLYGTTDLWVSNDRVSCKPPCVQSHTHEPVPELIREPVPELVREPAHELIREPTHWDCDPWNYHIHGIQGLVYLTDTSKDQGPFMCVPSIYRNLARYKAFHAADPNRRSPKVEEEDLVRVPGPRGSLVVFNRLMPHTSALNESVQTRYVQYLTMMPADESQRDRVAAEWREKRLPDWAIKQSVSGGRTREAGQPAKLTAHGRRIAAVDRWQRANQTINQGDEHAS